jgi:integrase
MTLYATGARNAEVTRLKFSDFDKQRMVVHIQGGKGLKDRDVMLSPKLLEELGEHWHRLRRSPKVWLFPGNRDHCWDQLYWVGTNPSRPLLFPAPEQRQHPAWRYILL